MCVHTRLCVRVCMWMCTHVYSCPCSQVCNGVGVIWVHGSWHQYPAGPPAREGPSRGLQVSIFWPLTQSTYPESFWGLSLSLESVGPPALATKKKLGDRWGWFP